MMSEIRSNEVQYKGVMPAMGYYRHILIAIDLHFKSDRVVIERAMVTAEQSGAQVSLIHAVEHINAYGAAYAYPAVADLENKLIEEAKEKITLIAEEFNIPVSQQYVEFGSPKSAILRKASQLGVDLIVVGSRSRQGFELLMGSAASAILRGSPCDVLAVRVE